MEELRRLLARYGEVHWAEWIRKDAAAIERGDRRGVVHFLSAFGGMGSLNDVMLCPENGHRIAQHEVTGANQRLGEARARAHALAAAIDRG